MSIIFHLSENAQSKTVSDAPVSKSMNKAIGEARNVIGFDMPSETTLSYGVVNAPFNVKVMGSKCDLISSLCAAICRQGLMFGFTRFPKNLKLS